MKKRTARLGFTLVELIVAISVIGILASIVIISYTNWQNSIIAAQLKSDLNGAASAMESARTFNNSYPTLISNLTTFKPSKNITLAGGSSDGVVYCIDASSSQNASIHYFIDQNSRSQGAQLGTCSSRPVPVLDANVTSISTINLSWSSVPGATSYTLQIASSNTFADATTIATQPSRAYMSTGLLASTTYYYRVGVTNSGLWSATKSATTTITAPITPVVVTNTASGSTTWLWNAADCAAGTVGRYQYDYTTSGFDSGWLDTSNTSVNYTTATDGYTYTVQVKSKCYSTVTGTSSGWSGIASASYYKPAGTAVAANLMSGKTATVSAGAITGTMTNMSTSDPNGIGVGRSSALAFWTGGGNSIYFKPQAGFYDGIDTWTRYTEPNLTPGNIANGVSVLGVTGTLQTTPVTGMQIWTTPGTYNFTVPASVSSLFAVFVAGGGGGGGGGYIASGYGAGYFYSAGGGGGGQGITRVIVTPGQVIQVVVGAGGAHGTDAAYGPGWSSFGTNGFPGGNSSVGDNVATGGTGGGSERSNYQLYNAIGYGGAGMGYGSGGATGTWANSGGTWGYNYGVFGGAGGAGSMGVGRGGDGATGTGSAGQAGEVILYW